MQLVKPMDDNGKPMESYCTIFAWCLMSNHIHLLIQEKTEPISDTIKRLAISYAYYYNHKYGRESTLFHDRFRSEPCNDYAYFWRLIRYIHRNPVKAGITTRVAEIIRKETGSNDPAFFQQLDREIQNTLLVSLKQRGASNNYKESQESDEISSNVQNESERFDVSRRTVPRLLS